MSCNKSDVLFSIYRGDDASFFIQVLEDDEISPVDITGWAFKFTMKLNILDGDDKAAVQTDVLPRADADATQGIAYIPITREQTYGLLAAPYFFDIQREFGGQVTTVISGRLRVVNDVTRRVG